MSELKIMNDIQRGEALASARVAAAKFLGTTQPPTNDDGGPVSKSHNEACINCGCETFTLVVEMWASFKEVTAYCSNPLCGEPHGNMALRREAGE